MTDCVVEDGKCIEVDCGGTLVWWYTTVVELLIKFVVKTECEIVIGKGRLLQEPQDFWWPGCPQCEQWFCCELAIEAGLSVLCPPP